jgi:hypothetical protein
MGMEETRNSMRLGGKRQLGVYGMRSVVFAPDAGGLSGESYLGEPMWAFNVACAHFRNDATV